MKKSIAFTFCLLATVLVVSASSKSSATKENVETLKSSTTGATAPHESLDRAEGRYLGYGGYGGYGGGFGGGFGRGFGGFGHGGYGGYGGYGGGFGGGFGRGFGGYGGFYG